MGFCLAPFFYGFDIDHRHGFAVGIIGHSITTQSHLVLNNHEIAQREGVWAPLSNLKRLSP